MTRSDIGDAQAFIALAQEQRVYELLKNPQTLKMLADVVAQGGGWPKSRKETFEMACGQMVREHNEEHQAAQQSNSPPTPDQLLDAAGRLCAVQLISGVAGYTLRGQADEGYPAPDQCGYDSPKRSDLHSPRSYSRASPITASPRFTATSPNSSVLGISPKVIKSGLPARRVIALIEGAGRHRGYGDEGLVRLARGPLPIRRGHTLSNAIPLASDYTATSASSSTDEKRALLESLNREGHPGSIPYGG